MKAKAIEIINEAIYFHTDEDKSIVKDFLKPDSELTKSEVVNRIHELSILLSLIKRKK